MLDGDQIGRLLYLVLLLAAIGGYLMVEARGRMGPALRAAAAWGLIFLGVIAGYGLWSDIRRQVLPMQQSQSDGSVEVPRAADGHYYLTLEIAGTPVRFVVDTGATDVVLSQEDARRIGIDPEALDYLGSATTANGVVRTASVRLSDVRLGPIRDDSLRASVNAGELDGSLLGMSYLQRFSRIEIAGDRLVLTR
ncbi:MAG: TIGR02281 family clan AA aspartic protease [Paracoccaceae bacterium]